METDSFNLLFLKVRSGDPQAATELVNEFEPEIRREVRLRLRSAELRRTMDSMDVCQSVLGNFFVRVALGQFDLSRPEQLSALLIKMARNKVIDLHRRATSRGGPTTESIHSNVHGAQLVDRESSPSEIVASRE